MASPSILPHDIMSLIQSIKSHFDEDHCLHSRDALVKCRALAAAAGCSDSLEAFLLSDDQLQVITAHIQMLSEALDLVRNDSSGVCAHALLNLGSFLLRSTRFPFCFCHPFPVLVLGVASFCLDCFAAQSNNTRSRLAAPSRRSIRHPKTSSAPHPSIIPPLCPTRAA